MEEQQVMEASHRADDLRLPLRNLVQGLREVASQLREGESWKLEDFDLQFFWKTLGECFKAVSQEATKLSLAFSKPPLPPAQDCQKLTAEIQKSILNVASVYYWLPKSRVCDLFAVATVKNILIKKNIHLKRVKIVETLMQRKILKLITKETAGGFSKAKIVKIWNGCQNKTLTAYYKVVIQRDSRIKKPRGWETSIIKTIVPKGLTLRRLVRDATMDIAEGVIQLLNVILSTPLQSLSQDQLTSTGGVWEACDRFSKIPKDNHAAVLSLMSTYYAIVEDALEEMKQAQRADNADPFSNIFEDDDSYLRENRDTYWSEEDKRVIAPCLGLLKAAKACLKKVSEAVKNHGKADTLQNITQLDDLGDVTNEISPSVDELVLSLYPPMNYITVQMNAVKVASVLKKSLEIAKSSHVCLESESNWLQFLSGAIDHNMDKVKDLTHGSS